MTLLSAGEALLGATTQAGSVSPSSITPPLQYKLKISRLTVTWIDIKDV